MKGKFILSAILLAATTLLISCEKQGQQEVDPITGECTFSDNLTLTINGRTIKGCTAVYTPGGSGATIAIFGSTVDIDKVISDILPTYKGSGRNIVSSDIIPGEDFVKINVTPSFSDGKGSFEGNGTAKYCAFSYKGSVTKNSMIFDFRSLALTSHQLAGTFWSIVRSTSSWHDMIILDWSYSKKPAVSLYDSIQTLLSLSSLAGVSIDEYIARVISGVNLYADGMFTLDSMNGSSIKETVKGSADFVVLPSKEILVHPEAEVIIKALDLDKKAKAGIDMNKIAAVVSDYTTNIAGNGIPIAYSLNGSELSLWFEEDAICDFLQMITKLLNIDGVGNALYESIRESIPGSSGEAVVTLVKQLIPQLQSNIDHTKSAKFGFKFKAKSIAS